jgi:WhiB family transcriptional regulator, redox-sensing transcriptional regulator
VLVRSVPLEGGSCHQPEAVEAAAREEITMLTGAVGTLLDAAPRAGLDLPCRSGDADLWFAESPAELERAKTLCADCPVRAACLAGALEREEPWGVWGGEIFERGVVVPRKRPRGRPSKADLARDRAYAAATASAKSA